MGIKTVTIYKDHHMYSQIHAANAEKESSGKTTQVWSDVEDLNFTINSTSKTLEINASCNEVLSSGARGGEHLIMNRTFYLELEKESQVQKLL